MSVTVRITRSFKAAAKPLLKRYPSLPGDLLKLEKELLENPKQGTALGHNAYKIRLKISSKGKGKSGGARADTANISDKELKELIKAFHQDAS